jgi:hypothetical protein
MHNLRNLRRELRERFGWWENIIYLAVIVYCAVLAYQTYFNLQHAIQTAFYGIAAVGTIWAVYMIFSNPIKQRIAEDRMVAARKADENPF